MKKLIIFLFSLVVCITGYANIFDKNDIQSDLLTINETVTITVPLPSKYDYNGGTLVLRNTSTGKTVTLSNGSAWYDDIRVEVEKGSYVVTSLSVSPCSSTPKASFSTNGIYTLYVGSTVDIQYSGAIIFGCQ